MAERGRGGRGRGRPESGPPPPRSRGIRGYDASIRASEGRPRGDRGRGRGPSGPRPAVAPFRQDGRISLLNENVTRTENNTFATTLESGLAALNLREEPVRPSYGTRGRSITLWTNYFELLPSRTQPYFRYSIAIDSDTKGNDTQTKEPKGRKLERLVGFLLQQLPSTIPVASDYKSTILAASSLGFDQREYRIVYELKSDTATSQNKPQYTIRIQRTGSLEFGEILDYLSSTDLNRNQPMSMEQTIQALNIIVGHGMKSSQNVMSRKNSYAPYDGNSNLIEKGTLVNGLEAFRGFFMSVRYATGRVLLNVQIQNIATWEAIPLPALYQKLKNEGMSAPIISRTISGLWVQTSHLNGRLKRVTGLASPADGQRTAHPPIVPGDGADALKTQFWKDDERPPKYISVAAYFERTYRKLGQPNLPVINVGTRQAPIYLPIEVCTVRKMQEFTNKLSPEATAAMIRFAVRKAPDNAQRISSTGIGMLQAYSGAHLERFNVQLNPVMLTVSGRVLSSVGVTYRGNELATQDASWNMRNVQQRCYFARVVIHLGSKQGNGGSFGTLDEVAEAVDRFHVMMVRCGIVAPKPLPGRVLDINNPQAPESQIDQFFRNIQRVTLLLVVLPFSSTALYNAVKKAGDVKFGIHTINVLAEGRKFAKMGDNSQYFANVALKFNLKFGGQNQLLKNADLGFVSEGKTMIVGLDVTHPSPGSSDTAPSVASITASIDSRLGQWPADIAIQERRKEPVQKLKAMFTSRLRLWQKHNQQRLPEEIIVYRDGVGDSMYNLVRDVELVQIKQACAETYPAAMTKADRPYLSIIICGKRIKTRFYPTQEEEQDERTGGTKSGTIVDRGITQTRTWDFYLQAHTALQGTPRPTHYVVVHDEIFRRRAAASGSRDHQSIGQLAANSLESLTHAMCYMYGRATKAVSLCPPAYYADLACDRARRWLSNVFDDQSTTSSERPEARIEDVRVHPALKDSMFYI